MPNMTSIKFAQNRSILNPPKASYGCSCRDNTDCSPHNQCLTSNIVSQTDVSNVMDNKTI